MTDTNTAPSDQSVDLVGQSVRRVEDVRFLTGAGRYLADVVPSGSRHVALLRSPIAHGRIRSIDLAAAREAPGVHLVVDGPELARTSSPFGHLLPIPTIQPLEYWSLAIEKVRYVGEPIAAVVADTRALAEDAVELIDIDFEELPPVLDAVQALEPGAPRLFEEWSSNELLSAEYSTGDLEGAFAEADGVLRERITQHRVIGLPLEGHGACGSFDPSSGRLVLHASSQQPHNLRTVISSVTGLSESKIDVIAPDMGGGFGNKQHFLREEALVALLAMRSPHPVVWSQDRTESLTSSVHSREQIHDVKVAYRSDGRLLGLHVEVHADLGSPTLYFTSAAPALVTTSMLAGTYDIEAYGYALHAVATNKGPIGAYRGFGQPQAIITIERIVDLVAGELGLDPVEVRRVNFIPDSPRPFVSPTGAKYDTGSFGDQFSHLLDALDYEKQRQRQAELRAEGRYVGIGLASMVEATAPNLHAVAGQFGGFEMAIVTVHPDGHVSLQMGTKSQGQGHRTVFAQVAADVFTIPMEHVEVRDGDTSALPYGMGTWGSRSAVMGGGVVMKGATQLRDKMTAIAANMLSVPPDDVTLQAGMFHAGEAALPFAAVAGAAYLHTFLLPSGMDMGLSTVASYDPGNTDSFPDERGHMNVGATYSTAAAAVVVEVDPNTGRVRIDDMLVVDDAGRVINPMIVDGQIQGAAAQAIGQVLLEELIYSDEGQPLTTTLADYLLPTSTTVPRVRIEHRETPSELAGGFRGAGEAAIVSGPAALVNAVADALSPAGIRVTQTNLSPARVRALIRGAGVEIDAASGLHFGG
ncbi:MAG: hypothetical protein CL424_03895 [Acidimicrobiaceae bacterium]|nr:hypothetical protein [Acidimicrobiaceae bacterium]